MERKTVALVLGGHINGYSIIRELSEQGIQPIALFDYGSSIARKSNLVSYKSIISNEPKDLEEELIKLNEVYEYIVVYPTDDSQIENLHKIYNSIKNFCYLPFNKDNIIELLDKFKQYEICEKVGIPYPKSILVNNVDSLKEVKSLAYPILIKPVTRVDAKIKIFRSLYIDNEMDLVNKEDILKSYLYKKINFLVSEVIPGDDSNIYAYTCFRNEKKEIINEWVGKKLTQYPDEYGMFSSATNEWNEKVRNQGRILVDAMDANGIVEPEFKYDPRDKKYKLMEVNFRSMMWHRLGSLDGVKLQETQFMDAVGLQPVIYKQSSTKKINYILMLHEVPNLISRKGYVSLFWKNISNCDQIGWAVWNKDDVKPFMFSLKVLFKTILKTCFIKLKRK